MTDRHTADSITDDALDALYQQLEDDAKVIRYLESQEQRLLQVEGELTALRQVARGYCPACGRGDAAPTVADWEQQKQRADRAEAALERVRRIHTRGRITGACNDCGQPWPCEVTRALDQPTPTAATPATDHQEQPRV